MFNSAYCHLRSPGSAITKKKYFIVPSIYFIVASLCYIVRTEYFIVHTQCLYREHEIINSFAPYSKAREETEQREQ